MKLKLKLVGFSNEFYPKVGGISNYVIESLKTFKLHYFNCEQWVPYNKLLKRKYYPFRVKSLSIKPNQNFKNLLGLFRHVNAKLNYYSSNLIHVPEPGPLKIFSLILRLHKSVKFNLNVCVHGSEVIQMKSSLAPFNFEKFLSNLRGLVAVSRYTKYLVVSSPKVKGGMFLHQKVKVVPPSIKNPSCFKLALRKRCQLGMITVGRLHKRKGHLVAINNIGNLLKFYGEENITYTTVGPLLDKNYFKSVFLLSTKLNVSCSLKLCKVDGGLTREYSLSNVHLMTSVAYKRSLEGFGLVYVEANLCGLPAIANNTGGVGDAVLKKHTGFFVDKNIHKFTKLLVYFKGNLNRLTTMGFFSKLYSKKHRVYWGYSALSLVFL